MLRIWNTALTQEQIQENMNSSVASVETGLLADWRFNVGDGIFYMITLAMGITVQSMVLYGLEGAASGVLILSRRYVQMLV